MKEYAEGSPSSGNAEWMDKVVEAIETVFAQRPTPQRPHKAVLWDLFTLDPGNGGWKKFSDRGAALMRLDTKTLGKLRGWLEEQEEEAINRYDEQQYKSLYGTVSLNFALSSLPYDAPLGSAKAYYTKRGTSRDLMLPIRAFARAEALREEQDYISEREVEEIIEKELGVPRSTFKKWTERMEEVGMAWHSFTTDQLEYVALGKKRGRPKNPKP